MGNAYVMLGVGFGPGLCFNHVVLAGVVGVFGSIIFIMLRSTATAKFGVLLPPLRCFLLLSI